MNAPRPAPPRPGSRPCSPRSPAPPRAEPQSRCKARKTSSATTPRLRQQPTTEQIHITWPNREKPRPIHIPTTASLFSDERHEDQHDCDLRVRVCVRACVWGPPLSWQTHLRYIPITATALLYSDERHEDQHDWDFARACVCARLHSAGRRSTVCLQPPTPDNPHPDDGAVFSHPRI